VDLPDGSWVLVRPSGTEPYLRVYVEAEDASDRAATVVDALSGIVEDVEEV